MTTKKSNELRTLNKIAQLVDALDDAEGSEAVYRVLKYIAEREDLTISIQSESPPESE